MLPSPAGSSPAPHTSHHSPEAATAGDSPLPRRSLHDHSSPFFIMAHPSSVAPTELNDAPRHGGIVGWGHSLWKMWAPVGHELVYSANSLAGRRVSSAAFLATRNRRIYRIPFPIPLLYSLSFLPETQMQWLGMQQLP